ncbi:uncharacterized protein LOC128676465 isoform X2 [Plodia interpunctella]|uniref:uncharacterized protein LOC128676465 isoform X2 n=1 Tax=Plodia interpunctella TaxID=58824 RepID=UPI0023688130|nr:uncharacterized protein LOC128676465 isoform X2 [Plodia interpunctella]
MCRVCNKNKVEVMAGKEESTDSDGPIVDDNIIRIQLRKPCQRKWELRTRNLSSGNTFPTIQLFDCDGNLLVETNDDNISIKSSDFDNSPLKSSQSLKGLKDYKHYINKNGIRKHNTISGDKVFTRVYRRPVENNNRGIGYIINDGSSIINIPDNLTLNNNFPHLQVNSLETTSFQSESVSDISSYKSSDNETCENGKQTFKNSALSKLIFPMNDLYVPSSKNSSVSSLSEIDQSIEISLRDENGVVTGLHKSKSLNDTALRESTNEFAKDEIQRSKSGIVYHPPHNKVSFLNTYLKSLPARMNSNPDWFTLHRLSIKSPQNSLAPVKCRELPKFPSETARRRFKKGDSTSDNEFINIPTDIAANCEIEKRLKMYRRGLSEIETRQRVLNVFAKKRSHSVSGSVKIVNSSSSESLDEADVVLNRLKRRILKNKMREKRRCLGEKFQLAKRNCPDNGQSTEDGRRDASGGAYVGSRQDMGSNISQHSNKGLKGRRARSSGDLCNGDSKSQTESSVCGSVVGDVMGWNRSLPNHLDGNRHLADYSRVNNNYGDFTTYRSHPKGGRGLRYRVTKSGSNAEPVWKLQDPGFDQGYGSERSPEEDYVPPIVPPISLEAYEAELRTVYPFINDENTFTVVVEKDGRGLGMSVCGGGGLVKIRRLYPPQPAWRTGRLAPRDLLLSANGVPLAGLSTYEALEVLRTAAARVELRICRPPPGALESVTPPDPPTPPARTPHPHLPPMDPLNCHPMHARLSQTTSSATTSSSEGRGRREASPEVNREDLRLPDLDRPMPVYDVQYGEFDIVMSKVNGSLGFTLRKEDHSALGHYVRALVREPALSDGRIQPGDRIVAVNDTPMSNMSHAEAVAFLRACGSEVRLRLYRDHAATPLSPMSPKEEGPIDSDGPLNKTKPPLRAEAVSMLCDLAARRLTPDAADGSRSPCLSPRKFRKLTKDNNHYEQPNDQPTNTVESAPQEAGTQRAHTVTVTHASSPKLPHSRQQKLSLTVPPHGYELNNLDNAALDAPNVYQEDISRQRFTEPVFSVDSDEPVSMPAELSSDERFKHSSPAYQSAVLHTSSDSASDGYKDDNNGLKKWKGVALSPENERKVVTMDVPPPPQPILKITEAVQKENIKPEEPKDNTSTEPTIVTVELNRGWNSRLGFSVQSHPESGQSYISAVYSDSVAARDGRLRRGDVILQVNDENVTSMKTPEVIDLLRILRGSICITVLRPPNPK